MAYTTDTHFDLGETVYRASGASQVGVIEHIILAVTDRGWMNHPAKAYVRWPDGRRLGGNGYKHSMVALTNLRHASQIAHDRIQSAIYDTYTEADLADQAATERWQSIRNAEDY